MNKNQTDRAWARAELKNTFGVDTPLREETMTTRLSREQIEMFRDVYDWTHPFRRNEWLVKEICNTALASLPSEAPTQAGGAFEEISACLKRANEAIAAQADENDGIVANLKAEIDRLTVAIENEKMCARECSEIAEKAIESKVPLNQEIARQASIIDCFVPDFKAAKQEIERLKGVIDQMQQASDCDNGIIECQKEALTDLQAQLAKAAQGEAGTKPKLDGSES